jgi:hypothetical protein
VPIISFVPVTPIDGHPDAGDAERPTGAVAAAAATNGSVQLVGGPPRS